MKQYVRIGKIINFGVQCLCSNHGHATYWEDDVGQVT